MMSNLHYPNREFVIPDRVDNTIPALTKTISFLTGQLLTAWWARIFCKLFDPLKNLFQIAPGY
jgi:hypothetical protein